MTQYSILQDKDILAISKKYALNLINYESIEDGAGNTNYLVRTAENQYILTIFEIEHVRVANISRLLSFLEKIDFPTTRIQRLANGDTVTSFQGKPVLLKPYLAGQVVENMDENMVSQVGTAIANLHMIPNPGYLPNQHAYGLETFPRIMDKGINFEYEDLIAQKYVFFTETIPSGLPRGLIHGDVFIDNVLFEDRRFKALIDFEEACLYYKVFDLGMAVVGFCTEGLKVMLPKIRSLVNGYQKIRVLEEAEKKYLQLFIEYSALATSSWRFWKHNIDTPLAELSGIHWEMTNLAIDTSTIPNKYFMNAVFS